VEYFRNKYRRSYPGKWPDPFGNVTGTITDWRDSILNYIDCKSMFNRPTVSNSFAEFANGRIKEAYALGHHYSYEVLRLKCVYGGVMVRRRPPHPLDAPRLRAVAGPRPKTEKSTKVNPTPNLEVLRQARIEADDTRGLLPNPQEHPGFVSRFNKEEIEKIRRPADDPEPAAQMPITFPVEEEERPPAADDGRKRRGNYDPDQFKLF
jgi:hypothetical protein